VVIVDRTVLTEVIQLSRPACVVFLQLDFSKKDNSQNASEGDFFLSRLLRGHGSLISDLKSSLSSCNMHLDLASPLLIHCLLLTGFKYAVELGITAIFLAVGKEYIK
jgi:hypothetical protein